MFIVLGVQWLTACYCEPSVLPYSSIFAKLFLILQDIQYRRDVQSVGKTEFQMPQS